MALRAKSLIVYNIEVTELTQSLDFLNVNLGTEINATLSLGFYSPTSLADEIARAMNEADPANTYSCTVDRSILGGTQNRLTISTNGTFLSLLFATGSRAASSCAGIAGFNPADYTGATEYTGAQSTGTALIPDYIGYNYLNDLDQAAVFGAVNVSASGLKEAVVYNIQKFINIQFKYEPASKRPEWSAFFNWAIQQRPFDFTPEITDPTEFEQVTLEKSSKDGKGLAYLMSEMLPSFPNHYDTGLMVLRIIEPATNFL